MERLWQGWKRGQGQRQGPHTRTGCAQASGAVRRHEVQRRVPTMLRKGHCDFEERTGKPCKFTHVKGVPPQLASVEGLITSDLRDYEVTFDFKDNTFVIGDHKPSDKPVMANVLASDFARIAEEMAQEEEYNFEVYPPGELGTGQTSAPVFPGR